MRDYGGRSAEQRRAERRAQLIEAGFELFGTQGYANTSIRALLRRAELQDRYFTENFASMEELLGAVYDQIRDVAFEKVRAAGNAVGTPVERLRLMIDANVRILEEDPRFARVTMIEIFGAGPVAEQHRQRGLRESAAVVAGIMPPLLPGRGLDRDAVSMAITVGVNGLFMDWVAKGFNMTREQVVEHSMLLVKGVLHEACEPC
ncbi:TetR/AcrR family transcriptional regulator [Nonomuraea sp. B12E4]|uniref:TetR/AcrR family transcriptional regulator n=1 Tax=Nonomuraea sp. B12E4 TaxID=3153564 RepID=UPI00325E2580